MVFVGESVDHRHARILGEAFNDRLLEGADHHHVDHARDDACEVFDRLSAGELGIAAVQVDGDAAELIHARFERHPGARGSFLENHRQGAVAQRLIKLVALEAVLDPARPVEEIIELVAAEIAELQEMLGRHLVAIRGFETGSIPRLNLYQTNILSSGCVSLRPPLQTTRAPFSALSGFL